MEDWDLNNSKFKIVVLKKLNQLQENLKAVQWAQKEADTLWKNGT